MSDSSGSTIYQYDSLSRMSSETRTIAGLSGSYTVGYTYTLSNQLNSLTDPFGAQIGYPYDSAGRPSQVTGSSFGGVTWYASNLTYRAWGGLKSLNYSIQKLLTSLTTQGFNR
jgi:YD repeat-containing protein